MQSWVEIDGVNSLVERRAYTALQPNLAPDGICIRLQCTPQCIDWRTTCLSLIQSINLKIDLLLPCVTLLISMNGKMTRMTQFASREKMVHTPSTLLRPDCMTQYPLLAGKRVTFSLNQLDQAWKNW